MRTWLCPSTRTCTRARPLTCTRARASPRAPQVAKIESERLLGELVESELKTRAAAGGGYSGKLALQFHYFG